MKRRLALVTTAVGLLGVTGALAPSALARSPKCFATPLAGHPGTYIVTCTTNRP